jgi:uncharacterized protein with NRDE domain
MCIVFLDFQPTGEALHGYKLVVAANRDEYFARPAETMSWRGPQGDQLCGRFLWTSLQPRETIATRVASPQYLQETYVS